MMIGVAPKFLIRSAKQIGNRLLHPARCTVTIDNGPHCDLGHPRLRCDLRVFDFFHIKKCFDSMKRHFFYPSNQLKLIIVLTLEPFEISVKHFFRCSELYFLIFFVKSGNYLILLINKKFGTFYTSSELSSELGL